MLPTGHVEFTCAALNLPQRRRGIFLDTDYRLVARWFVQWLAGWALC